MEPQTQLTEYTETDLRHTAREIELARRGIGLVSPNPLVGCVVVDGSGEVVGEGCYIKDEVTHAEVVALRQAGERDRGVTDFVSL